MKLTPHQEKIIEAIIDGHVYDITSYLKFFNKAHNEQYDINEIKSVFEKCEDGKTYSFRLDKDSYYYTDVYDKTGMRCDTFRVPNKTTYEFVDNPIFSPVKAHLQDTIDVEKCFYDGETYCFDFLKNSYPVAESFDDIIDFITLWSYLKREALILEVSKHVINDDISIFFELKKHDISPFLNSQWMVRYEFASESTDTEISKLISHFSPHKKAMNYIENQWKLNEEHFLICEDFIGKKIIASSELRVFRQKKFKTVEQISHRKNMFVAWVAVGVSVISVLIGNIIPLFQPKETDYLLKIEQSIIAIEQSIKNDTAESEILRELEEINVLIEDNIDNNITEDTLHILEELKIQIDKLYRYLLYNN